MDEQELAFSQSWAQTLEYERGIKIGNKIEQKKRRKKNVEMKWCRDLLLFRFKEKKKKMKRERNRHIIWL